jgi:hypothetical protein
MALKTTVPSEGGTTDIASLLRDLDEACEGGDIAPRGICRSLQAKLQAAEAALERGQPRTAVNQLRAFLAQLKAQRSKHVSEAAYQRLKSGAEALIAALS